MSGTAPSTSGARTEQGFLLEEDGHLERWAALPEQQRRRMEADRARVRSDDPNALTIGLGDRLVVFGRDHVFLVEPGGMSWSQRRATRTFCLALTTDEAVTDDVGGWRTVRCRRSRAQLDVVIADDRDGQAITVPLRRSRDRVLSWADAWRVEHPPPVVSDLGLLVLDWVEAHEVRHDRGGDVPPAPMPGRRSITEIAKALGRTRPEVAAECRRLQENQLVHVFARRPATISMRRDGQHVLAAAGLMSRERFVMPPAATFPFADDTRVRGRRWLVLPLVAPDGSCDQVVHRLMPHTHPQEAIGKALAAHAKTTGIPWQVHPDMPYKVLSH